MPTYNHTKSYNSQNVRNIIPKVQVYFTALYNPIPNYSIAPHTWLCREKKHLQCNRSNTPHTLPKIPRSNPPSSKSPLTELIVRRVGVSKNFTPTALLALPVTTRVASHTCIRTYIHIYIHVCMQWSWVNCRRHEIMQKRTVLYIYAYECSIYRERETERGLRCAAVNRPAQIRIPRAAPSTCMHFKRVRIESFDRSFYISRRRVLFRTREWTSGIAGDDLIFLYYLFFRTAAAE